MEIIRADKMGFCFGVKAAIDSCHRFSDKLKENVKVYILGMLVHNEHVVEQLKKEGFITISESDVLEDKVELRPQDVVIIRAHGTRHEIYEKLKSKGVTIEDAACVFVKNIREKLLEMEGLGDEIIFIGDAEHPEVEGIISFGKTVKTYKDLEAIKKAEIDPNKRYSVLTQTTYNKEKMKEIKNYLEKNYINVTIFDKICGATQERQEAVQKLAKNVDIVLIVGGKKSSNTMKLYEISKGLNNNTKIVTDDSEVDLDWFKGIEKVGISAGASTPEEIIKKIENKIRGNSNA